MPKLPSVASSIVRGMDTYLGGLPGRSRPVEEVRATAGECSVEQPMYCPTARLDELFWSADPEPIEVLLNDGGRRVDVPARWVETDQYWRGFFPTDHALTFLNRFAPIPAGFHKRFWMEGDAYRGETTDSDGVVTGHNRLREVEHRGQQCVLLTYSDLQYRMFYDLFVPISEDVLVGKAYLGRFPYGLELLTFAMTCEYGFDFLAPVDHRALWDHGTAPDPSVLKETAWEVRLVSNAGLSEPYFEFRFDDEGGELEMEWEVLDVWPGRSRTELHEDVLKTFDFTHWHDEIRQLTDDFMVGKWGQGDLQILPAPEEGSLGYVHAEETDAGDGQRLALYYVMNPLEGE
jgi:hypothetical protein